VQSGAIRAKVRAEGKGRRLRQMYNLTLFLQRTFRCDAGSKQDMFTLFEACEVLHPSSFCTPHQNGKMI